MGIKANELRLGNWISEKGKIMKVDEDFLEVLFAVRNYDLLVPIPVTPEILEKAGFKKDTVSGGSDWTEYESFHNRIILVKDNEYFYLWHECGDGFYSYKSVHVKSFHQLQNLYFVITGEELSITWT